MGTPLKLPIKRPPAHEGLEGTLYVKGESIESLKTASVEEAVWNSGDGGDAGLTPRSKSEGFIAVASSSHGAATESELDVRKSQRKIPFTIVM